MAVVDHPPDPVYYEMDLLDFISELCDRILSYDLNAKIVISGDINQLNVRDLLRQHVLQKIVKAPTRGQRTLDVFLTVHF